MSYQHIEVQPVAGAIGAEIVGADLSEDLADDVVSEIRQALLDNLVIFFREQDISDDDLARFGRRFGCIKIKPRSPILSLDMGCSALIPRNQCTTGPSDPHLQD